MIKFFIFFSILILSMTACSSKQTDKKELIISTNSWIGYAPLYYAKAKGYLDKLNIKLIVNVSLNEAADVYLVGDADMVSTTQHEFHTLKHNLPNTVPVMLFDRSNGGDMILSNKTLQEIKSAKKIDAYLEIDSINSDLLLDFIHFYQLDEDKFNFINKDQGQIQSIQAKSSKVILIVTYTPYNLKLTSNGFQEIISTKSMQKLIVVDALCTDKDLLEANRQRFEKLKTVIDNSIAEIQADKKGSYLLIKGYLNNISYLEYLKAFAGIEWVNHPSETLLKRIEPIGYKKEFLIK